MQVSKVIIKINYLKVEFDSNDLFKILIGNSVQSQYKNRMDLTHKIGLFNY